jgi:hypothetical protein
MIERIKEKTIRLNNRHLTIPNESLQYAVNQATENIKKLENKVLSLNNNLTEK